MANSIYLKDGYIYSVYEGYQTQETVSTGISETEKLVHVLRQEGKPVHILIDLTNLGKTHSAARKLGVEGLRRLDFDKIALFGNSIFTKHLLNFIITASGKQPCVKYFDKQEEAQTYLMQNP